jgi:putative endonuclease
MKQTNYIFGKIGEEKASDLLSQKDYVVIEKNYRNKLGEIDLICQDRDWIVFVEVKLKVGDTFGSPEEMISYTKIAKVFKTAQFWLLSNRNVKKYRIDMVAVVLTNSGELSRINHYENIGADFMR